MAGRDLRPVAVTGVVALVSVGLLVLAVVGDWLGADVGRGDVFCEVPHDLGGVFQPANSLSNFWFVVAGLAVAWRATQPGLLGNVGRDCGDSPRRTPSSRRCWGRPAPRCTRPAPRSAAISTC